MLNCPDDVTISRSRNKDFHMCFVVTYSGLGIFVHYGCLSCPYMYTVIMTRKLSYRKDDHAMRPINGCPENFPESLSTPLATFREIFNSHLFRSILWICVQNLKFVPLPIPEIIGALEKFGQSLNLNTPTLPFLRNFQWGFILMDPVNVPAKFEVRSCSWDNSDCSFGWGCEHPVLGKRRQ